MDPVTDLPIDQLRNRIRGLFSGGRKEVFQNMDKNAIERWLKENTKRCPIGRVTRQQCKKLRSRPLLKDAGEYELVRPSVCIGCKWWLYFPEQTRRKKAA